MNSMDQLIRGRNLWYLDLIIVLGYGFATGYFVQRSADSGQIIPGKMIETISVGVFSYLVAFIVAIIWRIRRPNHIYWVSAGIIGSTVFAATYGVVLFITRNPEVMDHLEKYYSMFATRLLLGPVLYTVPILVLLIAIRFVHFLCTYRRLD